MGAPATSMAAKEGYGRQGLLAPDSAQVLGPLAGRPGDDLDSGLPGVVAVGELKWASPPPKSLWKRPQNFLSIALSDSRNSAPAWRSVSSMSLLSSSMPVETSRTWSQEFQPFRKGQVFRQTPKSTSPISRRLLSNS